MEHSAKLEFLFAFRGEEGNEPRFFCQICQRRFVSQSLLNEHIQKGLSNYSQLK